MSFFLSTQNAQKFVARHPPSILYRFVPLLLLALLLAVLFSAPAHAELQVAPDRVADVNEQIDGVNALVRDDDFGQQIINYITYGSSEADYHSVSLLSAISKIINIIALCMIGWLAVMGAGSFVIHTANKGSPGGQVISSFWMPLRIMVSTILLIPLASGFSTLQYGVVTIAEKGNATANMVMATGLDYLSNYGIYRAPTLVSVRAGMQSWVLSEMCRQYQNASAGSEVIVVKKDYKTMGHVDNADPFVNVISYDSTRRSESGDEYTDFPRACGEIRMTANKRQDIFGVRENKVKSPGDKEFEGFSLEDASPRLDELQEQFLDEFEPKVAALAALFLKDQQLLEQMKDQGESAQGAYEQAVAELDTTIQEAGSSFNALVGAADMRVRQIATLGADYIASSNAQTTESGKPVSWVEQTNAAGWPALGTIFWQMMTQQSAINALSADLLLTFTPPSSSDPNIANDARYQSTIVRPMIAQRQQPTPTPTPGTFDLSAIASAGDDGIGMDAAKSAVYSAFAGATKWALFNNSSDDLLINLQYMGSMIGGTAESLFWTKVLVYSTFAAFEAVGKNLEDGVTKVAKGILGDFGEGIAKGTLGTVIKGGMAFASKTLQQLDPLINSLLMYMIVIGFVLGVVLPTIPLTQWFLGVISWMLFYIQCLLVSPFWMAAHGTAENEGWGSEHTRQGYMLMIGLFLNPILRVAGFFAILIAIQPIGMLAQWFIQYLNGVVISGGASLFLLMSGMVVVCIFAYTAFVRIFSFPSELMELGLRWINGGQEVTGDSNAEHQSRSAMAIFTSKAEGMGDKVNQKQSAIDRNKPDITPQPPTQ